MCHVQRKKTFWLKYEEEIESIWREKTPRSRELCARADEHTPGGALRSHSTGTYPAYGERVDGCYKYDVDGNRYLDLVLGMTCILGHNHPKVAQALQEQVPKGSGFLHARSRSRCPGGDDVQEGALGRQGLVHPGWIPVLHVGHTSGQSLYWQGQDPEDPGWDTTAPTTTPWRSRRTLGCRTGFVDLPKNTLENVLMTHWNDKEGTEKVIRENKDDLAAVLTEGLQTGGTIPPRDGYLTFLREITSKYGIVLIFDEIVNFWLDHGGTGALYDVEPDLSCYGKGIGGGLPMGMIGGRDDIMKLFSQKEQVRVAAIVAHQGDPMTVAASTACLEGHERRGNRAHQCQRGAHGGGHPKHSHGVGNQGTGHRIRESSERSPDDRRGGHGSRCPIW